MNRFEYLNLSGILTSVIANIYACDTRTVVVIIDDDLNFGMSAVNAIEPLSHSFLEFHADNALLKHPDLAWIVCNANTYGNKPEPAEYAQWKGNQWKWLSRDAIVAETTDTQLPEYRGANAFPTERNI